MERDFRKVRCSKTFHAILRCKAAAGKREGKREGTRGFLFRLQEYSYDGLQNGEGVDDFVRPTPDKLGTNEGQAA